MLQRGFSLINHVLCGPTGSGNTSNGEYVDIEVSSTKDSETMKKCLNGVMSEALRS